MHYRISFIFITFVCLCCFATTGVAQNANTDEDSKPVILYSGTPKKYEIADIKVADNDHDGVAEAIYKYLIEK